MLKLLRKLKKSFSDLVVEFGYSEEYRRINEDLVRLDKRNQMLNEECKKLQKRNEDLVKLYSDEFNRKRHANSR